MIGLVIAITACRNEILTQQVSLIGRFDVRDPNAPRFAWPGTQIQARFSGTFIRAVLSDVVVDPELHESDWIEVTIDDGAAKVFRLSEGRHVYPLASHLAPGEHVVRIGKRTEAVVGVITFHGFQLEPGARTTPTLRPMRNLEFVGDSITAGYGVEGPNADCHWSARLENHFRTFAALAARELGADHTVVAGSGKGVVHNYEIDDVLPLPAVYPRVIPTEDSSPPAPRVPEPAAYVVNLGTNDAAFALPDETDFRTEYLKLLRMLRSRAPHALIVMVLGPMLFDLPPTNMTRSTVHAWLASIEAEWRRDVDDRITLIEFWSDPSEGYGCDFHPSAKTHARLGKELAAVLRAKLGW